MKKAAKTRSSHAVYGPVRSWRLGMSLGIDLLLVSSICSFRCVYCQLGKINLHTAKRKIYVSTDQVIRDLKNSGWQNADVITFSGNGEPTLASNLGEAIRAIKNLTGKPIVVLTNAAHLNDQQVRTDLINADQVFCKLDAADEKAFQRINKPVSGLDLESVTNGIKELRNEYKGFLAIQTMYQPWSNEQLRILAKTLTEIQPDEIQLNFPSRSIPREWFAEARGNYDKTPYPAIRPRRVLPEDILELQAKLRGMTNLKVISSYLAD